MKKLTNIESVSRLIVTLLMMFFVSGALALFAQTPPNTQIRNQAKSVYTYKNFPADTILSNPVQFNVLSAPNFEISFGVRDTNVFGKETLQVRLVYKNVGNAKADTATINGVLPLAGLRFVPGSTGGTIAAKTVTWKIFNVNPGQTDSVAVKVVVDSTLLTNTQLEMQGNINWLSTQATTSKIFVVSSFPRLEITSTPSAAFVGSGRTVSYQIVVRNSGNITATNVSLVDTLSSLSIFQSSGTTPDSMKGNGKIIVWKLGNISAFSQKLISVTVSTPPNLASGTITNSALAYATNVTNSATVKVTTPIVAVVPKTIEISADPKYIFGMVGLDSSKITVVLRDSLNLLLPDGVPVTFATNRGSFSNTTRNISAAIQGGSAIIYLRPENVANEIIKTTVNAVGGSGLTGTVSDSVVVLIYPGAVSGKVVNGLNRIPFAGAIARVYDQAKAIVGADTTKNDGKFFIPLNKDVKSYLLEIFVIDKFGDTVITTAPIDPTQFPKPPIEIPNTISGRIQYKISGLPVPAEGITVYLDSVSTTGGTNLNSRIRNLPVGVYARIQQQATDALGRFKFENLRPARYIISVDSTQFPVYKGYSFISDTVSGTFTINLSIEIEQDSSLIYSMQSKTVASAGDTLRYSLKYTNAGNLTHYAVEVVDTLPAFTTFIAADKGRFTTVAFDTAKKIVRWNTDSILALRNDSLHLTLLLSRNIPDSTQIINRSWYKSSLQPDLAATNFTTIRSVPILSFGNFFAKDSAVAGDSVTKRIWFSNTGTDSIKGMKIIDTLYSGGKSYFGLSKVGFDSLNVADSVTTIYIGAIAPGESDTISVTLFTEFSLPTGTKITSSAHLLQNDSSLLNIRTSLNLVENVNISSYLKIVKTGNKKGAEIGDIVTYQLQISNTSPTYLHSIGIHDLLPHSFKYVKNSARYNGKPFEPSISATLNKLTWNPTDTIQTGKGGTLVYQLAIGADATESQGVNTAYASALTSTGFTLVSAPSEWQVTVRPGVFTQKGLIIGKVFYDDNRNTFQEMGEEGIKGIELLMEDGTRITTGDDGKYSLPEVKPGQHVLRVNERTLPSGTSLLKGNNKFAGDPSSQFVILTESGIAKANFFVARSIEDSVHQKIGKVNKLFTVRQAKPKYVYNDTLRKIKIDTLDMYVSFVFSGPKYLQSIEVNEVLPSEMTIVPNSGVFNGRKANPIIVNNRVQWNLGRAQNISQGTLRYKVTLKEIPKPGTSLLTISKVRVMTYDSLYVESQQMISENIVKDVEKNIIETSDVITKVENPALETQMADSVVVSEGDDIFIKISLFIDPKKKIKSVKLLDSLEAKFVINERSFAINGIPLPSKNLSVRVRSSALSARAPMQKNEIEFTRIANADLTELIRMGLNEITYSARLADAPKDTVYYKTAYTKVTDTFNDEKLTRSNDLKIMVQASRKIPNIAIETSYVDIPRPVTNVQEKIADAMKVFESFNESSTRSIIMEGITFEPGKSTLTQDAKLVLDNVASMLSANNKLKIQINGHTDNTGNAVANRKISLERAKSVRTYLISKGINETRLSAQGFGSDKPITTNKTEKGREKNRRVEFVKIQ